MMNLQNNEIEEEIREKYHKESCVEWIACTNCGKEYRNNPEGANYKRKGEYGQVCSRKCLEEKYPPKNAGVNYGKGVE